MERRFPQAAVLAVCLLLGVIAFAAAPSSVSAQERDEGCGNCDTLGWSFHVFTSGPAQPGGEFECDNTGGCHMVSWYLGWCSMEHVVCGGYGEEEEDQLLGALDTEEPAKILDALAVINQNWEFDPTSRTISVFDCGDVLVARYPVSGKVNLPRAGQSIALEQ